MRSSLRMCSGSGGAMFSGRQIVRRSMAHDRYNYSIGSTTHHMYNTMITGLLPENVQYTASLPNPPRLNWSRAGGRNPGSVAKPALCLDGH